MWIVLYYTSVHVWMKIAAIQLLVQQFPDSIAEPRLTNGTTEKQSRVVVVVVVVAAIVVVVVVPVVKVVVAAAAAAAAITELRSKH